MASHRSLRIPSGAHKGFRQLIQINGAPFDELLSALRETAPTLSGADFISSIAGKVRWDNEDITDLVRVLIGLYITRNSGNVDIPSFVESISEALQREKDDDLKPADGNWEPLKQKLSQLLEFSRSVGVTAKALDVMTEHEKVYLSHGARILTDMRPIFPDDANAPSAAVIIHTLKIGYQQNDDFNEFFVALDSNDLQHLRAQIDRAVEKEQSLRAILSQLKIPCLEASGE